MLHLVTWKGETYSGTIEAVTAWVGERVTKLGLTGAAFTADPPVFGIATPDVPPAHDGRTAGTDDATPDAPPAHDGRTTGAAPGLSTWEVQVIDEAAKTRIEGLHAALISGGVKVDASQQLYTTGTRMAAEGYASQHSRKAEHDAMMPFRDVTDALISQVQAEGRREIIVSAGDLAREIKANGKISAYGMRLTETALRGLAARLDYATHGGCKMIGYVLGMRDRIAAEAARGADRDGGAIHRDVAQIADVLRYECQRAADVTVKLRVRDAMADVYAIVSPTYASADAPEVVPDLAAGLAADARGSYAYDPGSTAWELRAHVWTPTPVDQQAVGEPFEGFASYQSRDDGGGAFSAGGGVNLLRCLNASTYVAQGAKGSRRHTGRVRRDVADMTATATHAIGVLCQAWGRNRQTIVPIPAEATTTEGRAMTIEEAIPGFWRALLTSPASQLARLIPGRTETHVTGLSRAYADERRDPARLVRADLAQGWTRYIQDQPAPVRREAEVAIGSWLAGRAPVGWRGVTDRDRA